MRHKILFISSWYPNRLQPTNGNFVQRHAEAAATMHDVEVLHAIGNPRQKRKFIFDEQMPGNLRTLTVYYRETSSPALNFLRRMKAYRKGFKRMQRPDLVHGSVLHNNLLFAVYLKKKYKIPFVVSEHWTALMSENQHKTSPRILKIAKRIAGHASYILPVSKVLRESLKNLGIRTPMKVVSNVVDTGLFFIKEKPAATCKFLHISSLVARKNPLKIIETAIKLRRSGLDITLEIGGDGDLEPLKNLVKAENAGEFIRIFGPLSYAEVAGKMQHADCFVLFSDNETQGCVILESFACGKPVISTNVGGVPEFLNPDFGRLIPAGDCDALYQAMRDFSLAKFPTASPEEMRNYVLSNFSKQAIAQGFTEVYDKVLAR